MRESGGSCLKYLKKVGTGNRGGETEILKGGRASWVKGWVGCLKKNGGLEPPYELCITVVDVLQNWLNWFHFLFLEGDVLVILIDCMTFLSPFLDVTRMSISTFSFLAQLD